MEVVNEKFRKRDMLRASGIATPTMEMTLSRINIFAPQEMSIYARLT